MSDGSQPLQTRKRRVTAEQLVTITEMAARGCREIDIARACGMSQPVFGRLKKEQPEIIDALEAGRQVEHDALRGKLFDLAMNGQVVPAIFLLKTRHGYRENDAPRESASTVVINLPSALPADQYRVLDGEAKRQPDE